MPLSSVEDVIQKAVGKSDHWRLFARFQGSDLHTAIIANLQRYLDRNTIDSSIAGSEILGELSANSPHLFDGYSLEQTGGLFGMTLWNLLAEQSVYWYFVPKKGDPLDDVTGTTYFRPPVVDKDDTRSGAAIRGSRYE